MLDEKEAACRAVLEEIDEMVGCEAAKRMLHTVAMQMMFFENLNGRFAFIGEPGTGKTRMALHAAKLLHAAGALPTDKVVECSVETLLFSQHGSAEEKIRAACEEALGGTLVIDVAGMPTGEEEAFGSCLDPEAVGELITYAEMHREKFCLIFTGGQEAMRQLFSVCHWFPTRIKEVCFAPFTPKELTEVFLRQAKKDGIRLDAGARETVEQAFTHMVSKKEKGFGNARSAIRFYEDCRRNLARRSPEGAVPETEAHTMIAGDIPNGQEGLK